MQNHGTYCLFLWHICSQTHSHHKSVQVKIISLITYCCITNSPKFSDVKQQLSDCGSRIWKGHSRTGLSLLWCVWPHLKRLDSWAWRIHSQHGFFTHISGSWAGLLQAGLSGDFNQSTYMWSLCVPWASHSVADRIQEGTFQEQGFQENQMEAVWPLFWPSWKLRSITSATLMV